MKKFWLFLLSLGLVMAFSVSALAADVKFSGEYYVAGLYLNHVDLRESGPTPFSRSTAFFYQRLRLGTDFVVSPCLRLVTRMDIMERVWEPDNTAVAAGISDNARNVDFDVAYIDYVSGIGKFQVGYMPDYAWGTIWANRTTGPTAGQIKYFLPIGPVTMVFAYAKEDENDFSVQYPGSVATDRDQNSVRVGPIFKWNANNFSGNAGILFTYDDVRQYRGAPTFFKQDVYTIQPYFQAKIGPVSAQGEINYAFGERRWETGVPLDDIDINSFSAFLDADANIGIVSVGGSAAFVQGQDPDDTDEINSQLSGGRDWDPCLILFNNTTQVSWVAPRITTWVPAAVEAANYKSGPTGEMRNAWFVQGRIGVTPIPKLTFKGSVSYAAAHEQPDIGFGDFDRDYGWELDLTGTYKITNNLTYMLGGAYLWTGDYFKAGIDSADLEDEYMIINKLTLNF